MSGKHFISHNRKGILVCGSSLRSAAPLFRRHVGTGTACSVICHTDTGHACMDLRRKSEVKNLNFTSGIYHYVAWLDIAMNNFHLMSIIQCIGDLFHDWEDIIKGKFPLFAFTANPAAQVFALTALHNKIIVAVGVVLFQVFTYCNILMNKFGNQLKIIFDIFHFKGVMG